MTEPSGSPRRPRLPRTEPCPAGGTHEIVHPRQRYCDRCRPAARKEQNRSSSQTSREKRRQAEGRITISGEDAKFVRTTWANVIDTLADVSTRLDQQTQERSDAADAAARRLDRQRRDELARELRRLRDAILEFRDVFKPNL